MLRSEHLDVRTVTMGISLFQGQHCTSFCSLVDLLTSHCLIKVYFMSIELRSVYTGELYLAADSYTACTAHSRTVYHNRIQTDNCGNLQFFG